MGIYTQGKRDVADAEFRREGLDEQKDAQTFRETQAGIENTRADAVLAEQRGAQTFRETQAGIENTRADKRLDIAQEQHEQNTLNSYYTNILKFAEAGKVFPGETPNGISPAAEQVGLDLGTSVQHITSTQRFLTNSRATQGVGKFDATELSQYLPQISGALGAKVSGELNDKGHIVFSIEEGADLSKMSPGLQDILTGATPVTPDMLSGQLSRDIGSLRGLGKPGERAMMTANAIFDKSPATSAFAAAAKVEKARVSSDVRANTMATSANRAISTSGNRWKASKTADAAAATQAENVSTGKINQAYAEYLEESQAAKTQDEISAATNKYNRSVVETQANFNKLAGKATDFNTYETVISDSQTNGAFNNQGYDKQGAIWDKTHTLANAQANTDEAMKTLEQQANSEGMEDFVKDEMETLMAGNPSLSSGDARDQAGTKFNNKVSTLIRDARTAAVNGSTLDSGSMRFMLDYTKETLGVLRLNNISSYLSKDQDAESQRESDEKKMANKFK